MFGSLRPLCLLWKSNTAVPGGGVGWGVYATSQTSLLHMKRFNKTECPGFVLLCILCFQRQPFRFYITL